MTSAFELQQLMLIFAKLTFKTRSSAVAERPHNALCVSVVSFNSTVP